MTARPEPTWRDVLRCVDNAAWGLIVLSLLNGWDVLNLSVPRVGAWASVVLGSIGAFTALLILLTSPSPERSRGGHR